MSSGDRHTVLKAVGVFALVNTLITFIVWRLWRYAWFRILFSIFVICMLWYAYQFSRTWDSFAPKTEMEQDAPVTVAYDATDFIVHNGSDRLWLTQFDATCTYTWRNGDVAFTKDFRHSLNGAWLAPGRTTRVSEVTAHLPVMGDSRLSWFTCKLTNATFREVLDNTKYEIAYTYSGERVTAKLFNFNTEKLVAAIDAVCYTSSETVGIELLPADGPNTKPKRWGMFSMQGMRPVMRSDIKSCQTVRVRAYDVD